MQCIIEIDGIWSTLNTILCFRSSPCTIYTLRLFVSDDHSNDCPKQIFSATTILSICILAANQRMQRTGCLPKYDDYFIVTATDHCLGSAMRTMG